MKHKEYIVAGCKACHLVYEYDGEWSCNHPSIKHGKRLEQIPHEIKPANNPRGWIINKDGGDPILPKWCPLKKEPITIVHKLKGYEQA
jgi:hypothetical protein